MESLRPFGPRFPELDVTAALDAWAEAQEFERAWWADCANTFGEEAKQISYAHRMGLAAIPGLGKWPVYDLAGRSVLDLGGGPVSILLKTINGRRRTVVDPCGYPPWVAARYAATGISYRREAAEDFCGLTPHGGGEDAPPPYDEVWIYNVLQHVQSPARVIASARRNARLLRIFEWIELPAYEGHPHALTASGLDDLLGVEGAQIGTVETIHENGIDGGLAYFGTFNL